LKKLMKEIEVEFVTPEKIKKLREKYPEAWTIFQIMNLAIASVNGWYRYLIFLKFLEDEF
jgi:hypothetical protein